MRKTIASHIGLNPETQKKMIDGLMEVELVPQGTLIERIRAKSYSRHHRPLGVPELSVNGAEYLPLIYGYQGLPLCNPRFGSSGSPARTIADISAH